MGGIVSIALGVVSSPFVYALTRGNIFSNKLKGKPFIVVLCIILLCSILETAGISTGPQSDGIFEKIAQFIVYICTVIIICVIFSLSNF